MVQEKLSNMGLHPAPVYALAAFLKMWVYIRKDIPIKNKS